MDGYLSDEAKTRANKILCDMRLCDESQKVWKTIKEFDGVLQEEILLSFLCEYEERKDAGRLAMERTEACRQCLRGMWRHIEAARSPLQPRYNGQYTREFANALRELSCNAPSLYPQAWKNNFWEDETARVAKGIPDRAHRLRALGNAVVPQIPELIGRAILEAEAPQ